MNRETETDFSRLEQSPIAQKIPPEVLEAEVERLAELRSKPAPLRLFGFLRMRGPGFMDSALTLACILVLAEPGSE